jgi:hypothetical protein
MFAIFCLAMCIFVIFFLKETKRRTLEEMDLIFGTVDEAQRRADVEYVLQKGAVLSREQSDEYTASMSKE